MYYFELLFLTGWKHVLPTVFQWVTDVEGLAYHLQIKSSPGRLPQV